MADYTKQIQAAYRMIRDKGMDITVTRSTPGAYNTSTGAVAAGSTTTQTLKAINPPSTQGRIESFDNMIRDDASLIGKKVRFFIVSALGAVFVPERGDKLTAGGASYTVIGSTPLSPNGQNILFKVAAFT
jgi:hypothetical protein